MAVNPSCPISAINLITEPTFWIITAAALVDSINPCAIAVLLILLTSLLVVKDRRRTLKVGIAFIAALFIAYYAVGFGILQAVQLSGLASIIHKLIGLLAIVIGLVNLRDFVWYRPDQCWLCVPDNSKSLRGRIQKMLGNVISPVSAFVLGLLVTLVELPCTGGPYFFVLGLLSQSVSLVKVALILVYYNLIFVLPLVLVLLLAYFGYTTVEKTVKWKDRNSRIISLLAGVIMVSLGVWLYWH